MGIARLRPLALAGLAAAAVVTPARCVAQSTASPAAPAPKLHVEGVFDDILAFEDLHDKPRDFLMNTTRATLRLSGTLDPHLEYRLGVVGRLHTGSLHVDNVPFLPPRLRSTIVQAGPAGGRSGAGRYLENEIASALYVQEAYATFRAAGLYLRAGRQKVQSGTGYAYNPTDLFNRRVPLDPTYEADGVDAVAIGFTFSPKSELQLLAAPRGDPSYRARFQGSARGLGLALQFTSIVRGRVDWQRVNTLAAVDRLDDGRLAVEDFERRFRWNQLAAEFSKTTRGLHLYGELGVAFIRQPADPGTLGPDSRTHERLLLGADYTFASKLHVVAEYMRLGEGRASGERLTLNDEMASFKGETLSADVDNAFVEVSRPLSGKVAAALKVLGMLDHAAVGVNPWLYVDPRPKLRLAASLYGFLGRAESTYSNVGLGAFLELKYTF